MYLSLLMVLGIHDSSGRTSCFPLSTIKKSDKGREAAIVLSLFVANYRPRLLARDKKAWFP